MTYLRFVVLLGLASIADVSFGQEPKNDATDIAILKRDVKMLVENQQQMIAQLNELKQLLLTGAEPVHPPANLSVNGEPFKGAVAAQVAIIEYADFECQFCGDFMREVYPQIAENYIKPGKVKYFYRDLPMRSHTHALAAARAARCAGEQDKFWQMHESLFADQAALAEKDIVGRAAAIGLNASKFNECLSSERYTDDIRRSTSEAQKMGINGTPTFLLGVVEANGDVTRIKTFVGAPPYENFKSEIDGLLASEKP
jgi:protein-disulfide isomerase